MKRYYVMDIGGTLIKYALMNEKAEILEQGKYPAIIEAYEPFMESLTENIDRYVGSFDGIAVSMPGRIDTATGIVHTGGAFRFFKDDPLEKTLEERYHVPATLGNDAKCAAQAELESGSLKDVNSGAVIVIGTAIGGAIVLDHKVVMGSQCAAGEFSFMVTDYRKYADNIRNGCFIPMCTWAGNFSATALIRNYAKRKNEDPSNYDGIRFFEAYDAGDPDAIEVLEDMGGLAASGIMTIQTILDLEKIAIGGGISARQEVTDTIRRHLDKCFELPGIPFRKPEIVRCRYGNDANLIGALSFHLHR